MSIRSSKKSSQTKNETPATKRTENSWILLLNDSLFEQKSLSYITLPHPLTQNPAKYCLDSIKKKIYETVTYSEEYRSWFIGETVKSDGNLIMITPVNPLYLVLPRLRELCKSRAMQLEDILSDKGYEKIIEYIPNLSEIADVKVAGDITAYKYNEEKTLMWLEKRIRKLANVLREKNVHVTSGAISATFVTSSINNENINKDFYLKYAFGILSEYLEDGLHELLEKHMNFPTEVIEQVGAKRKSEQIDDDSCKRLKSEDVEPNFNMPLNESTDTKKPKILTAKEKARQKAATGTKTISSFFTKKAVK